MRRITSFLKRRWLEFRWGYNYISYIISGVNFITITYYLLLEGLDLTYIPIHIYALIVAVTLPNIAIAIGHFYHRKKQLTTDILVTNEPLLNEFRRILQEELDKRGIGK